MQNREHNSRFILIGLLGQKRENNFKIPFFVQNSVRNYEFLEISVFCTKAEENNNLINILTVWPKACVEKKERQLLIYLNWFVWSIKSKELRFAVLDKTCAKELAQLCCCLKLSPSHTVQLSFCFQFACIVKKIKLVQDTVRNWPVAWNWPQNALRKRCFPWNWRLVLKLCKPERATVNLPKLLCQVRNVRTFLNLQWLCKTVCETTNS